MTDIAVRTSEEVQAADSRAFALEALDAIDAVTTPDEAEALLARVKVAAEAARVMHLGKELAREWRGIEIKAERKWGELLGEANRSANAAKGPDGVSAANTTTPSGSERVAQHEARKLAAIPEPVFEQYVGATETPTKAGLLRAAEAETPKEPTVATTRAEPTGRAKQVADATRDRVDKALHTLDGLCVGLAGVDPKNATLTATKEQTSQWLATAERARANLREFTTQLRQQT